MYKLILGNVRITVLQDHITRNEATCAAQKAIAAANQHGKLVSHIEIDSDETGIQVKTTEKSGNSLGRKTIKQSILDGMLSAVQEKLYPTNEFTPKDSWLDSDTGKEWRGAEVDTARSEILSKFKEWMKIV